jgi:transposase
MGIMRKSSLSHYKQDRLIEHFVLGSTSLTAARLRGVNRKTSSYFFLRLREIIALELELESEAMFGGEIEVDESYFGGRRKGRRGRRAGGKIPVFGLLKGRQGLHQDHPERFQRNPNADHGMQDRARQHRLF